MVKGFSLMFLLVSLLFVSGVTSRNFTIENKCDYTVWPGVLSSGTVKLSTTGFALKKGDARVINAPSSWIGRFWGRTICSTSSTGNFSCATGDCGSGKIECSKGSAPPTTLAEFTLDGSDGQDFYDVSLVDGYNLPLVVVPQRPQSGQTCPSIGCVFNLTKTCPPELMLMRSSGEEEPIACMSACQTFRMAEYCCTGEYSTPEKCQSTGFSKRFKNECPLAKSYAYDNATSTFTCSNSPNYVITFCPPITPNLTNNNRSSVAESPFPAQTKNGTVEPPSESRPFKETNGGTKRVTSRNFTIENKCDYTVWPGVLSSGTVKLSTTGFALKKGDARVINAPSSWTGRFWGRSICSTSSTGNFSCATGDCGSGKIECSNNGSAPPTTLAEFTLDADGKDYYDVSLVDGYNLPLVVVPQRPQSGQTCPSIGCVVNLTKTCPSELKVMGSSGEEEPIACMSACQKFKSAEFCCTGEYSTSQKCQPTLYAKNIKNECPLAYSYAYDDVTSAFTSCSNSPNYVITFCPPITPNITNNNRTSAAESPFPAQTKNGTVEPPSESKPSKEINGGTKQNSSRKLKLILGVSAALTVMIIIVVVIIVITKNAIKSDWNDQNVEAVVMLKRYSYKNVKTMTNSFAHVLGKGGFGTVYKGKLPDSGRDVAVKILKESEGNGEEFINEVASMSRTSHVNIVSLLGFCYERKKRAIIYEFMPNGSLDKYISENMSTKMEWKTLYDIAVGVSRGLEYLHNRCVSRIVHFDIKPQNILMDKNLCPKISDFGLAKLCKNMESIISMLDARGTAGYIAPEVFSKNFGRVSHKSDVYSYGMVVLEMIGARNIEKVKTARSNNSSVYFPDWIYKDFEQGEVMRILGDQITEEEEKIAKKMLLVGLWCIQTNPSDRPPMIKVIEMLEGNLESIEVPPKPLLYLPSTTVPETLEDSNETSSFSNPTQFERCSLSASEDDLHFSKEVVQEIVEESQHKSRSS